MVASDDEEDADAEDDVEADAAVSLAEGDDEFEDSALPPHAVSDTAIKAVAPIPRSVFLFIDSPK
ncbi:hypothetical protein [Arthrobacter sp. NtRootA1]|uniref:hypothetical protein n=1 Tax=Micrococcaceae TaxID=1268 RepID=UPI001CC57A57|nr:hypothetical protein [Arthrobacter sp. NtRootA1]BCW05600.1 hypothetical protein NtRootA1_17380 [Arthrobacter sp. NtRootA1]